MSASSIRFYLPKTLPLRLAIHAIWQVERRAVLARETILPKGVVEIVFNLNDRHPILAQLGGRPYSVTECFINGFNTLPIQLVPPEQQVFFGVQLQPLAIKQIFGIPASAFSNALVELSLVDPAFRSLWHQLGEQSRFEARVSVFCDWLATRLPAGGPRENLMNDFLLGAHRHHLSVTTLARTLCYSPRQLSRKIIEATGMNAEEMLLYKKYLHTLNLIHDSPLTLTEIAYDAGFCDQSHFNRAFKTFAGMTPGDYRRKKGEVPGHFFEDVR